MYRKFIPRNNLLLRKFATDRFYVDRGTAESRSLTTQEIEEVKENQSKLKNLMDTINLSKNRGFGTTFITSYNTTSFITNSELRIFGSMVVPVKGEALIWDCMTAEDLTIEKLKILEYIKPSPRLVVLGMGLEAWKLPQDIREYYDEKGFSFEVQSTKDAIGTFNILANEERDVIGFFITQVPIDPKKVNPIDSPMFFKDARAKIMKTQNTGYSDLALDVHYKPRSQG